MLVSPAYLLACANVFRHQLTAQEEPDWSFSPTGRGRSKLFVESQVGVANTGGWLFYFASILTASFSLTGIFKTLFSSFYLLPVRRNILYSYFSYAWHQNMRLMETFYTVQLKIKGAFLCLTCKQQIKRERRTFTFSGPSLPLPSWEKQHGRLWTNSVQPGLAASRAIRAIRSPHAGLQHAIVQWVQANIPNS